jgi:hypothetical protein
MRKLFTFDPHELGSFSRGTLGLRRHSCDRLAGIADGRIAVALLGSRVAKSSAAQHLVHDIHRAHPRISLGCRGVDRLDDGVSPGRNDVASPQHSGELNIKGVSGLASDLLNRVETGYRFADRVQPRVLGERRRLVHRDTARHFDQTIADNAIGHCLLTRRTRIRLRCLWIACGCLRVSSHCSPTY